MQGHAPRQPLHMLASSLRHLARSTRLLVTFLHAAYLLQRHHLLSNLEQACGQGLAMHMDCQTKQTKQHQWVQGLAARPLRLQAFAAHRRLPPVSVGFRRFLKT